VAKLAAFMLGRWEESIERRPTASAIFNEIKSRVKELQNIWKPFGLIASVVSARSGLKELQHRTGQFFPGGLLLFILSVAILYTIPIKSIRLLAARLVSFVVDLTILTLVT
jgi:hypothetical protein